MTQGDHCTADGFPWWCAKVIHWMMFDGRYGLVNLAETFGANLFGAEQRSDVFAAQGALFAKPLIQGAR